MKFTIRMKQKYELSDGQIFPELAGCRWWPTASVSKANSISKFPASWGSCNFSRSQTPNKCVFNLLRLCPLPAPSSVVMEAALQQQRGVQNSHGVCFAHNLHQYFMISFIMTALNVLWQGLTGSVLVQVTWGEPCEILSKRQETNNRTRDNLTQKAASHREISNAVPCGLSRELRTMKSVRTRKNRKAGFESKRSTTHSSFQGIFYVRRNTEKRKLTRQLHSPLCANPVRQGSCTGGKSNKWTQCTDRLHTINFVERNISGVSVLLCSLLLRSHCRGLQNLSAEKSSRGKKNI